MGKSHQSGNVGNRVFRLAASAERRAADVHRIRAVQHRLTPDFSVAGGGQQFKMVAGQAHGVGRNSGNPLFSFRTHLLQNL